MLLLTCWDDEEDEEEVSLMLLTFCRVLLLLLPSPLPNNTVGPEDPVGAKLLFFFCKSPNIEAISGLTCDAPDPSGKSDI